MRLGSVWRRVPYGATSCLLRGRSRASQRKRTRVSAPGGGACSLLPHSGSLLGHYVTCGVSRRALRAFLVHTWPLLPRSGLAWSWKQRPRTSTKKGAKGDPAGRGRGAEVRLRRSSAPEEAPFAGAETPQERGRDADEVRARPTAFRGGSAPPRRRRVAAPQGTRLHTEPSPSSSTQRLRRGPAPTQTEALRP